MFLFFLKCVIFVVVIVQLLCLVQLCVTPWTAVHRASLSFTIIWSLLKFMSIGSVILSNHLILRHPLLPLPSIFPGIRVISNDLALLIWWPNCWSFIFSNSPSNECSRLISFSTDLFDLLANQETQESSTALKLENLKYDAIKVLHSICKQIWKTQQWPQDWTRSIFILIPKKGNAKEFSNYSTIALISHTSKVMLTVLQVRLQQYMNQELLDVQARF